MITGFISTAGPCLICEKYHKNTHNPKQTQTTACPRSARKGHRTIAMHNK